MHTPAKHKKAENKQKPVQGHEPVQEFDRGIEVADWIPPPFPRHEIMRGAYCRLEPVDAKKHAQSLFAANALDEQGAMWRYLPYGPFESLAEYTEWLRSVSNKNDPQFYAIIDLTGVDSSAESAAVGLAAYLRITPEAGSIEIGHLSYSPLLQRSVVATEAMYLMMKKVFALGYRRYEWKCNALNKPSCRAALRLGFSYEGIFRQALVSKGCNRDTAWFAMIDKEWPALDLIFRQWLHKDNFDESGRQLSSLSRLSYPLLHRAQGLEL